MAESSTSDVAVLLYVLDALRRQEARHRQNAWPVPAGVGSLLSEVGFRVTRGHEGSSDATPLPTKERGPQVVRYESAARMLEVSVSTIKRLVRSGDVATVSVAGAPRIRVADLETYVDGLPVRARDDEQGAQR